MSLNQEAIAKAANLIRQADALLITAGAGMGVDSGLPDFRGPNGFWGVYPALGRAKIQFEEVANPQAFVEQPELAWGFYGHRLNLYRETPPGKSFELLLNIAESMPYGAFAFTSNVDGHFLRAGLPASRVCEVHGSIHHMQCLNRCSDHIWSAHDYKPVIDVENCRITSEMPHCTRCGGLARPNILMFGDWHWVASRQNMQLEAIENWLAAVKNLVVIEIGAGTAIPTVRRFGESQAAPLIRINNSESAVARDTDIELPMAGTEALAAIIGQLGG